MVDTLANKDMCFYCTEIIYDLIYWFLFSDNLRELADRMKGPFDIEEVVDPIGVKISDAIMNFQRSGYEVSERVKQECGTPRIQKREVIFFLHVTIVMVKLNFLYNSGPHQILTDFFSGRLIGGL